MNKTLPLVALVLAFLTSGAFAQITPAMQLDRDKKSLADRFKRDVDELSCGPMTHPGARKQCIFYRDISDNARLCAQRSLTQNDLTQCRTLYRADIRELETKPYSWFDPQLATCREKMTTKEDEYKKLFATEKAANTFTAADLEQLKIYGFENEGHRRNNRGDFFKQTNDQCHIQTDYYTSGIALINTKIKAKPQTNTPDPAVQACHRSLTSQYNALLKDHGSSDKSKVKPDEEARYQALLQKLKVDWSNARRDGSVTLAECQTQIRNIQSVQAQLDQMQSN